MYPLITNFILQILHYEFYLSKNISSTKYKAIHIINIRFIWLYKQVHVYMTSTSVL